MTNKKIQSKLQNGSIAVYAILLMAITLAIALPAIRKGTRNLEISQDQQTQKKTLNYAEQKAINILSEINELQKNNEPIDQSQGTETIPDGAIIDYSIEPQDYLEATIQEGHSVDLITGGAPPVTQLKFQWWENDTDCTTNDPASIIISTYEDNGDVIAKHYAYGPCNSGERNGITDNFETPDPGTAPYEYEKIINIHPHTKLVRIKPVYNDTKMRIESIGAGTLQTPQINIQVNAQDPEENMATQVVQIQRIQESAPTVLDYTLVSGNTINHTNN